MSKKCATLTPPPNTFKDSVPKQGDVLRRTKLHQGGGFPMLQERPQCVMHWETHVRRSRFQGRWWRRRYKGDKEKQCDTSLEDIHRSMMGTHVTIVTDLSSKIWIYLNVFNAMAQCLSARYLNELWKSLKRWRRPVAPSRWTYVHTYIYILYLYICTKHCCMIFTLAAFTYLSFSIK